MITAHPHRLSKLCSFYKLGLNIPQKKIFTNIEQKYTMETNSSQIRLDDHRISLVQSILNF